MTPGEDTGGGNRAAEFLAGRGRLAAVAAAGLLGVLVLSLSLVPIRADNDCWWHVKTGQYVAGHGFPEHDVFSFAAASHEWHAHEWLTQRLMWTVWSAGESTVLGGWRAVILSAGLTLSAGYVVLLYLAGRLTGNWWLALLVMIFAVSIGRRTFYPRPPVISNLLLAILLLLLTGIHEGWWRRRWLAILPPVFALWSNLHGGWMAGLVVLGAYAGADVMAPLLRRLPIAVLDLPESTIAWKTWAVVFSLCALATLANPFGLAVHKTFFVVMGDKNLAGTIGELRAPDWRFYPVAAALVVLGPGLFVLSRRRRVRLAEAAILLFFLWQGASHVRHLLLFGVMAVPLVSRVAGGISIRRAVAVFPVLAILCMGVVERNWPETQSYPSRNLQYIRDRTGYIPRAFPEALADFVELANFEGRMFNENYYAGYLIWRFSPEKYQVFSDSRFDIFGGEVVAEERAVLRGDLDVLDKWNINWAIVPPGTQLEKAMNESRPRWEKVADWGLLDGYKPWQLWVRGADSNRPLIDRARRIFESTTRKSIK